MQVRDPKFRRDHPKFWCDHSKFCFSSVYLVPKLETLWRDARFGASSFAITAVQVAYFVTQHFLSIAAIVAAALVFLEWRSSPNVPSAQLPLRGRRSRGPSALLRSRTILRLAICYSLCLDSVDV